MATKTVLSNVDLIRRFVFESQPVTADAITQELRRQMLSATTDEVARERYVTPVLRAQPYYREVKGAWTIVTELMPEYQALNDVMREEHRLMYEREIRSKIALKLGVKVLTVVLDLNLAPQLKRFGSLWGLADWVLSNDSAAEVLKSHPNGMSEKDLLRAVCERSQLDAKITILHLAGDPKKRFVLERKLWFLREVYDKTKHVEKEKSLTLPELKTKEIDRVLEGSFLEAQSARPEDGKPEQEHVARARLKKALKKQAQDILEQREDLTPRPEDLAARLSQVLSAAGLDDYGVRSFQRVEPAPKERGLTTKERDEIQQFMDNLLAQPTLDPEAPLEAILAAPLSARKLMDVLRLKHAAFSGERLTLPSELNHLLIELLNPHIHETVLHPACGDGSLTVELLSYLYEHLEGAAWAFVDDNSNLLELVQADGAHFRIDAKESALLETAKDKFMVSQVDLLNHYLSTYRYTGIEQDRLLARAARIFARLSGYENVYVANRDFLAELPEVFGLPPNEDNEIPLRFELVLGNLMYTQDANLAANYLEQSLRVLRPGGRLGVFVLAELMSLLKQHALLGEFVRQNCVTHYIRLPLMEGQQEMLLLLMRANTISGEAAPQIAVAELNDAKQAAALPAALAEEPGKSSLVRYIDQLALGTLIK